MRLLKCTSQQAFAVEVVELDKSCWKVLPPRKWQIALTLALIVVTSVLWSVL